MSNIFGLRQLSPNEFSELQKQQRNTPRRSSCDVGGTPSTTDQYSEDGHGPSVEHKRRPLYSMSSNASSNATSNATTTFRDRIAHFNKASSRSSTTRIATKTATKTARKVSLEQEETTHVADKMVTTIVPAPDVDYTMPLEQQFAQLQRALDSLSPRHRASQTIWRDCLVSLQNQWCSTTQALENRQQDMLEQLERREKEIILLSKRCAQQSDKLKSVHRLQAAKNSLEARLQAMQELEQTVQSQRLQLEATQEKKQSLQQELDRVNRDSARIREQLDTCQAQYERLAEEKQQWREERARLNEQLDRQQQRQQVIIQEERSTHQQEIDKQKVEIVALSKQVEKLQQANHNAEQDIKQTMERHTNELEQQKCDENVRLKYWQDHLASEKTRLEAELLQQMKEKLLEQSQLYDEQLTAQTDKINQLHEHYGQRMGDLSQKLEESQSSCASVQRELSLIREAREKDLAVKDDAYKEKERSFHREIQKYQQQIDQLATELREKEESLCDMERRHQNALERLQKEALVAIQTLQAKLQEKHSQVTALEATVKDLERSLSDNKTVRETLASRSENLATQVRQLTQKCQHGSKENEKLSHVNDTLRLIINELEAKVENQHADIASAKVQYESQISFLESSIQELTEKLSEKGCSITDLESELETTMDNLMLVSSELDAARQDSRLVASLTSDLEAVQLDIDTCKETLSERDVEVAELEAEILKLQMELELEKQQNSQMEKHRANCQIKHEREIQSLRNYIAELRRDLDQASRQRVDYRHLHTKTQSIVHRLEEELRIANEIAAKNSQSSQALVAQHTEEVERLCARQDAKCSMWEEQAASLELDLARLSQAHAGQLAAKEKEITRLSAQLDQARDKAKAFLEETVEESSLRRQQLSSSRAQVQRLETKLTDMEMNRIPKLESQLVDALSCNESLRNELRVQRAEAQSLAKERDEAAKLLREKSTASQTIIEQLNGELQTLRQAHATSAQQCQSVQANLEEALQRCEQVEHENQRLAETVATNQQVHIERSEKHFQSVQQLQMDLETQISRHEALQAANAKLQSDSERLSQDLKVKTKQCADMTSKANISAAEADACKQKLRASATRVDELEMALVESNAKCRDLSVALDGKDNECAAALEQERALRELLNEELVELKAKFEAQSNDKQTNADLIKEVATLKDKIRRQEAYLKRRLNKERLARKRGTKSQDIFRGVKSSESFSSHNSAPILNIPDVSLIDCDSSLDEELDSILAD